jgi:hypothetical protein
MDINELVHDPLVIYMVFYIASSAVQAMPKPTTSSSQIYIWLNNFLQLLLANWTRAKLPNTIENQVKEARGVV